VGGGVENGTNGRWWRKPSFSVEDIIKYGMVLIPALFAGFIFYQKQMALDSYVRTNVATKGNLRYVVEQANRAMEQQDQRLRGLEVLNKKILVAYPPYTPIRVYERKKESDDNEWEWER
jgi:hypothetical protein